MDTEIQIKQEDCFSDDLASQTERELFHKVIIVKSNSNAVLPDDNGCDMAIKTEIKAETSFPEREGFTKCFVKHIEFETVTSRDCKIVTKTKIEQAADLDFDSQKETEFLTDDPVMKTKNYNNDLEMDEKIEIKVEPWWLERETSPACDDVKGEDFAPATSSSSYAEAFPGTSTVESPLSASAVTRGGTRFHSGKNYLERELQKVDLTGMPTVEEHVISEKSGKCSEGGEMCMKQKTVIHQGTRPHKCKTCNKSFTKLSCLKVHNLIHEGRKPHQCKFCGKSFTYLSSLNKHNLIHEGKKPHQCKICHKNFTQLSHLQTHNLIHDGKKPHQCKTCNKNFTRLSHLQAHVLIHEGKKPHQCKTCNKNFTRLSNLQTHNLIHEGKKPHQCTTCDKSFTRLSHLKRHYLVHEGKKSHQCKICDKSFTQLSNLKRHYVIHKDK